MVRNTPVSVSSSIPSPAKSTTALSAGAPDAIQPGLGLLVRFLQLVRRLCEMVCIHRAGDDHWLGSYRFCELRLGIRFDGVAGDIVG